MKRVARESLPELAREVLARVPAAGERAAIIALLGDLGAGKTTFTQALALALGVTSPVQSPTYVLMKSYPISFGRFTTLVHIDAYRLEGPEQFAALHPDTFLRDPGALVCIEWPERVAAALPTPDVVVRFSSETAGPEERYSEIL